MMEPKHASVVGVTDAETVEVSVVRAEGVPRVAEMVPVGDTAKVAVTVTVGWIEGMTATVGDAATVGGRVAAMVAVGVTCVCAAET